MCLLNLSLGLGLDHWSFNGVSDLSSGSVLDLVKAIRQCNFPYVTHGGSTEISSHVESLRGISKSEISSFWPL